MILLVTPSGRALECAAALHEATGDKIAVAENLARATIFLRAESFLAVALDQYLLEIEPDEAAATIEHMGTAILVPVNLALMGMERLVREVRAALKRRQREEVVVRQAVVSKLGSELNNTVTALLLTVELAMDTLGLPAAATERLQPVHVLVTKLRRELENAAAMREPESAVHV